METGILYVVFNESIRNPETNERLYKIGITRNSVHDRYYGLGLKMPGKFETLFAYKLEDYTKTEQLIHGIFRNFRENGEWFNISQKELDLVRANCEVMGGKLVTDEFEKGINTEFSTSNNVFKQPKVVENIFNKTAYESDDISKITEFNDKCIIIKIHDKYPSVYERVRHCWKNSIRRVEQADYVLAVIKGKVEGVFEASKWYSVPMEECKKYGCDNRDKPCGRIEFIGKEADADIQNKYLSKYIPDCFMKPGPGPVQFTYKI